jgi:hypothetical protein
MTDPDTAFATARRTADALHDRAMRLGYNVGLNFHVDTDSPARAWFPVWRVDQESNTAKTFSTAEQVNKYLDELEKLPRYCLDLLGNPRIRTELDDASDRSLDIWLSTPVCSRGGRGWQPEHPGFGAGRSGWSR